MKLTLATALLISLTAGSVALADSPKDRGHGPVQNRSSQNWNHDDHRGDDRRNGYDHRRHDDRRYDGRYERGPIRYRGGEYRYPRGYYTHVWRRGERLPAAYYARPYIVVDYRAYRLRPPPRGYRWVRVNHDVLLTAIATGIVLDVIYNHFY